MSSRRRSSKGFSLRQPPIVYTVCNYRLLRKFFCLFSSRPKPKSTIFCPPSSSTTLTTTTAATTTTIDTRDPLSFTTNLLNEGRPNRFSTKTGQIAYSPSSPTTLTTTMAAIIYHTWDYYDHNYLNESRPNYHATRERKPRKKKRICNNGSVIRDSAPVTFTLADYYGRNNYLNESRPNYHATPMVFTSADLFYNFYKLMVEMITVIEINTLDDLEDVVPIPQT